MRLFIKATLLAALAALNAPGELQPYSSDSNTLHLWHLDEAANPLADSAGSVNLFNWGTKGTLGVDSISGLNKAYESSKTVNSDIQSNGNIGWGSGNMMGADGAFTWEMVLRPDEAANSGSGFQMLMQHGSNQMQLKLNYAATGYVFLSLYNTAQGTLVSTRLDAAALGINQYTTNEWFHLAFTYNGTDTGTIYWTRLGDDYTGSANELNAFNMTDFALSDAILSFGGAANLADSVFNGAIDEIRISDIARAADGFLQPPPPPPEIAPHTADSDTLHLWHLDETSGALTDSAASLSLYNWGQHGTCGVDSYNGLNKAYESSTTTNSVLQTNGDIDWNTEMMGADGAFTWEMVIRPDAAADFNNGGSGNVFQMLLDHKKTGISTDQMQLKLIYTASGTLFLSLFDSDEGTLFSLRVDGTNLGDNQYAAGEWFHLAVTHDGNGNGKAYWTKLGDTYTGSASELTAFSTSNDLNYTEGTLAIGGAGHLTGSVFDGAIDEVRISSIARGADNFLKFPFTGFEGWIAGYSVGTATNATDNPDGDALDNLAEFALGGDPSSSDSDAYLPVSHMNGGYLEYIHNQRSDADTMGLTYSLDSVTDLAGSWSNATYEITGTNVTGGTYDTVTNRVPTATQPVQFIKLVIESAE
jgi:hypothetical protein